LKAILDPKADNDRFVAYNLLQNAAVVSRANCPLVKTPGTAIVMAKKENVYHGVDDAEWLSRGF
jgi:fumarate hydratase class I